MTQLTGSLVGALVAKAGFAAVPNRFKDGSDHILVRDTVLTAGNLIGDTVVLAILKSTAFIDPAATIWFDAFGTSATLNIGDVNHVSGLASAIAIASAGSSNLHTSFTAAMMGYPLWHKLGYSSDPGGLITLLATFAGANPANANLAWKIVGQNS
jgi:hypothetical protein